jgi:hypothetical protein
MGSIDVSKYLPTAAVATVRALAKSAWQAVSFARTDATHPFLDTLTSSASLTHQAKLMEPVASDRPADTPSKSHEDSPPIPAARLRVLERL